ncbi:phosphatase PAP2 family protein [Treponema sp. OttesenSCG-928-L16]|nr:phosphatase PAP2 family protein [Treponema sp. OttesenSCG-928-L16]
MEAAYQWGLELIRGIQTIKSPALTMVMKCLTALGSEYSLILLMLIIFWCVDEQKGFRLSIILVLSAWANGALKAFLKHPRPYDLDPSLALAHEPSFGLPSGHAQQSLLVPALMASWSGRKRYYILALVISLVIAFTRLYLGVHFPTDIFGGWILALIILAVCFTLGKYIDRLLINGSARVRIICSAAAAFLMNALWPADTSLGGVLFGMGAGYSLMLKYFPFSAKTDAKGDRAKAVLLFLRMLAGLAGAALLFFGLKYMFPGEDSSHYSLFRFIRYGLLGLWASAGAPWMFLRLKLAGRRGTD